MEKELIKEEKGFKVYIVNDEFRDSPREWDNVGTMVCWHRRYNLGDKQPKESSNDWLENIAREFDEQKMEEANQLSFSHGDLMKVAWEILGEHCIFLPLFLYDHSGITMSTGPFSCPWDSGQVGWIYCTKEKARKEYKPGVTDEEIRTYLTGEVETYDQYLTGDVWGYIIENEDGDDIESCWGCYGYKDCCEEALNIFKSVLKDEQKVNNYMAW